jgi:hypothetical protein
MRVNPNVETVLRPESNCLEHTVVSQDEVIARLTQELSNLKERNQVLESRARVSETTSGHGLPHAEWVRLTAKSDRARKKVERLLAELGSLRDKKLTLVADLNSAILAKDALVVEKNQLSAERDTTFAEKEQALIDKDQILAEKDKVSSALEQAVSERNLAETDRDQAISERESTLEKLEEAERRCQRIRRKYRYYKAKVRRLSEQLSFVPWLRTKAWAFGFHIGFENFRALALRSDRLKISFETVSSNFLSLPSSCYSELLDLGIKYFPDILDWSKDAPNPEDGPDREHIEDDPPEGEQPDDE